MVKKVSLILTGVKLDRRGFIACMTPYFPFFTWYYLFSNDILKSIVDPSAETFLVFNTLFNFVVSFALILGGPLVRRVKKVAMIYAWSILSSVGTVFLILFSNEVLRLTIYFLCGVSFSLGLLAYFVYFCELTVPEERGRVAGSIGLIFLPLLSLIAFLIQNLDFIGIASMCIILNLGALGLIPLDLRKATATSAERKSREINPEKRTILFYLAPWLIFSLINATLAKTVSFHISQYFSFSSLLSLNVLQIVGAGLGALIGGIIADFFGRRLSLTLGLTLFGVCSAVSGLSMSYEIFILVFVGNGLVWGILMTLYLFLIWGDLSTVETNTHRYSIGLAIFYLAEALGGLFSPQLFQVPLVFAVVITCLLIFLSNVPVVLAPELLPSDFREKIGLRFYLSLVRWRNRKRFLDQG